MIELKTFRYPFPATFDVPLPKAQEPDDRYYFRTRLMAGGYSHGTSPWFDVLNFETFNAINSEQLMLRVERASFAEFIPSSPILVIDFGMLESSTLKEIFDSVIPESDESAGIIELVGIRPEEDHFLLMFKNGSNYRLNHFQIENMYKEMQSKTKVKRNEVRLTGCGSCGDSNAKSS